MEYGRDTIWVSYKTDLTKGRTVDKLLPRNDLPFRVTMATQLTREEVSRLPETNPNLAWTLACLDESQYDNKDQLYILENNLPGYLGFEPSTRFENRVNELVGQSYLTQLVADGTIATMCPNGNQNVRGVKDNYRIIDCDETETLAEQMPYEIRDTTPEYRRGRPEVPVG
jgi:hypothetical protein